MTYINKPDPILLGKALQQARKKKGLTQQELADALCVSNKAVSKWECGRGLPDVKIYAEIETLLDIKIDDYCIPDSEEIFENEGGMDEVIEEETVVSVTEDLKIEPARIYKKRWISLLILGICVCACVGGGIFHIINSKLLEEDNSSSGDSSSTEVMPIYDITEYGEYIFEAEKAELSEGLNIYSEGGSGTGYVGGFDYHNNASMTWKIVSKEAFVGQLYFSLVSRGIVDLCKDTYTIILNDEPVFSKTVFRDPYTSLITFHEYFIAEINLLQGENVLNIIFHSNGSNNNGHNFDYLKINTRPIQKSDDIILEAEEYTEMQGIKHYYDAGNGLGYVGGFDQYDGARLKYCFNVEETETRLMSICLNPRGIKDKMSDTYTIILNGEEVESKTIIYGAWKDWIHFEEYFVAMVPLLKGENILEIVFHANGNEEEGTQTGNGHNLDYFKFEKYSHYINLNEEKEVFQAEDSYFDKRLQVIQDGEYVYLGNFDASDNAAMQYFVSVDQEKTVALTINMIPRNIGEKVSDSFSIYVNGKEVTSKTIIEEGFNGWINFIEYYIADIVLEEGMNEILIIYKSTMQNGHNIDWIGLNPVIEKDTDVDIN